MYPLVAAAIEQARI